MGDPMSRPECLSLIDLQEIEGLLKCPICHEDVTTPVLTSCTHNFCSLCIRKWLQTKQSCPVCSKETLESGLRKNPVVENLLAALGRLKDKISRQNVKPQTQRFKSPPQLSQHVAEKPDQVNHSNTSSRSILASQHSSNTFKADISPSRVTNDHSDQMKILKEQPKIKYDVCSASDDDSDSFVPKSNCATVTPTTSRERTQVAPSQQTPKSSPATRNVSCPVCFKEMPEKIINIHLDRCILGDSELPDRKGNRASKAPPCSSKKSLSSQPKSNIKSSLSVEHGSNTKSLEPIKPMVHNLMSDAALKKELKKYGLSTSGDRRALSSRLQRFVTLYNSNCDATRPKSLVELKQSLEKEEKALNMPSATTSLSQLFKSKQTDPEELDRARKEYIVQNSSSFKNLIEEIRGRNGPRKVQTVTIVSDTEKDTSDEFADKKTLNGSKSQKDSSDSETESEEIRRPAENLRKVRKAVKRKVNYIDSDSDDDASVEETVNIKKGKTESVSKHSSCTYAPKENSDNSHGKNSPVLVSKTPVRRPLRKCTTQKKSSDSTQKKQNVRRTQRNLKQNLVSESLQSSEAKGSGSTGSLSVQSIETTTKVVDADEQNLQSRTPDIFNDSLSSSPASVSSNITCGQRMRTEGKDERIVDDGEEALSQLVSMIDEGDEGSSTDFEEG